MREIKFKAWDKQANQWFDMDFFIIQNDGLYENHREFEDGVSLTEQECELVQYTGLKDKNDKEIYEGDITDKYGYIITWVDESDSANLGMPLGWYEQRNNFESYRQLEVGDKIEVIGNIFENPELLKGGNQ